MGDPRSEYEDALDLWHDEDRDPAYRWGPWKIAFNAGVEWARQQAAAAARQGPPSDHE